MEIIYSGSSTRPESMVLHVHQAGESGLIVALRSASVDTVLRPGVEHLAAASVDMAVVTDIVSSASQGMIVTETEAVRCLKTFIESQSHPHVQAIWGERQHVQQTPVIAHYFGIEVGYGG